MPKKKPTTFYDAALHIVNMINQPHIFKPDETEDAIRIVVTNECPLQARGLVIDYNDGMLTATYGGGLAELSIPLSNELIHFPTKCSITHALRYAVDDLNMLFRPTSTIRHFDYFKYMAHPLAELPQFTIRGEAECYFTLRDYFAVVRHTCDIKDSESVYYLTREEAIALVDNAITLPYQAF